MYVDSYMYNMCVWPYCCNCLNFALSPVIDVCPPGLWGDVRHWRQTHCVWVYWRYPQDTCLRRHVRWALSQKRKAALVGMWEFTVEYLTYTCIMLQSTLTGRPLGNYCTVPPIKLKLEFSSIIIFCPYFRYNSRFSIQSLRLSLMYSIFTLSLSPLCRSSVQWLWEAQGQRTKHSSRGLSWYSRYMYINCALIKPHISCTHVELGETGEQLANFLEFDLL